MRRLLWFRRDLRVADHPALQAATREGDEVIPVFCLDQRLLSGRHRSAGRTQFLLESLADLDRALKARGSGLVVRRGAPERELVTLARELEAGAVHFSCDVGPFARRRDERVASALAEFGVRARAHPGVFVLDEFDSIRTRAGEPYTVFTPFYRAWLARPRRDLARPPGSLPKLPSDLDPGVIPELSALDLEQELSEPMPGGEGPGREAMMAFLSKTVEAYAEGRNALGEPGVSRLSPYLHLGCVSPLELERRLPRSGGAEAYRRQLCWRDFYGQVLRGFPRNARSEHQARYRGTIRWSHAERKFEAWCEGATGFPLVDAAMRQLRREGWIHNRARLVVGSFLTKDLGIDWRWGEKWFMRLLLDGDEASNNGNWQWIASVGVDPQPAFRRIFNPALQQQRFDPEGAYVRRYVPELRGVPDAQLPEPWRMTPAEQQQSGCLIGRDYPAPIVDHARARREALARYSEAH